MEIHRPSGPRLVLDIYGKVEFSEIKYLYTLIQSCKKSLEAFTKIASEYNGSDLVIDFNIAFNRWGNHGSGKYIINFDIDDNGAVTVKCNNEGFKKNIKMIEEGKKFTLLIASSPVTPGKKTVYSELKYNDLATYDKNVVDNIMCTLKDAWTITKSKLYHKALADKKLKKIELMNDKAKKIDKTEKLFTEEVKLIEDTSKLFKVAVLDDAEKLIKVLK